MKRLNKKRTGRSVIQVMTRARHALKAAGVEVSWSGMGVRDVARLVAEYCGHGGLFFSRKSAFTYLNSFVEENPVVIHRRPKNGSRSWWKRYEEYINSAKWKAFRARIIAARGDACEYCQAMGPGLHLHHLTYDRLGEELPEDVKLACEPCHQKQHPDKNITRHAKQQQSAVEATA